MALSLYQKCADRTFLNTYQHCRLSWEANGSKGKIQYKLSISTITASEVEIAASADVLEGMEDLLHQKSFETLQHQIETGLIS